MPATAMRHSSSSSRGRGNSGGGKADHPSDALVASMGGMSLSSFQAFCFDVRYPFMVFYTPFVRGRRYCVVDLLVLSMHESRYQVDIAENGMSILIGTEIPAFFTSSGRLEEEIPLQGDRDTLLAAHHELVDDIISHHGSREVMSTNPQVVKLPFPCDQDISKQMIWNEGDHLLYEMFRLDPDIEQSWHQMHPILRITLKSNKKAQNRNWDQTKVISPRNPRFAVRPGTGQGGRHAGANGGGFGGRGGGNTGGDGDDGTPALGENGRQASGGSDSVGARKPAANTGLGQSNSPPSVSFRSTGGPTNFVPTGLIAESFRRFARASGRSIVEEATRRATRVVDDKLDDMDDDSDL